MIEDFTDYPQALMIPTEARRVTDYSNSASSGLNPKDFKISRVTGVGANPDHAFSTHFDEEYHANVTLDQFSLSLGEWLALAVSHGPESTTFIALNDQTGLCPVFYALIPQRFLIVSDSFAAVSDALQRLEVGTNLDVDCYSATLATNNSQLLNPTIGRTYDYRIRELGVGKALLVERGAVSVIDRRSLTTSISDDPFQNIAAGIDWTAQTLSHISRMEGHHSLLLSGGVDSRTVLAILVAAGIHKDYKLRVIDPRQHKKAFSKKVFTNDFTISSILAERYGLTPQQQTVTARTPISYGESLAFANRYSSAFSFSFVGRSYLPHRDQIEYSLRGGGGEILKGVGFSMWRQHFETRETLLGWIKEKVLVDSKTQNGVARFIADHWYHELFHHFLDWPELSLYSAVRHRAHFGHSRRSRLENELPLQPLTNSYFMAAAKQLEPQELKNFAIPREVFRLSDPELTEVAFENATSTSSLAPNAPAVNHDPATLDSFFEGLKKATTPLRSISRHMRPSPSSIDSMEANARYVAIAMEQIVDAFPRESVLIRNLHALVNTQINKDPSFAQVTAARLRSALDLSNPDVAIKDPIILDPGRSLTSPDPKPLLIRRALLSRTHSTYLDFPPKLSLSVETNGMLISAQAKAAGHTPFDVEFAFYLMKSGKRVDMRKYAPDPCWHLDLSKFFDKDESFSIKAFARLRDTLSPFEIVEEPFEI